jgi:very-short-patch-repair endonuclease
LAPVVSKFWHPSSGELEGSGVTHTCERQRRYYCTCMQHSHTLTTKTLVSKHAEGKACKICERQADSELELRVRDALELAGMEFEVYCKVLGGRLGSADVYIPSARLIIAVDGPGHMEEAVKGTSLGQQMEVDEAFDNACMAQGYRLLRMHHVDIDFGDTLGCVLRALHFCNLAPTSPFVMFSKRYLCMGYAPRGFPLRTG